MSKQQKPGSDNKTVETTASVSGFIERVKNQGMREDSYAIVNIMKKQTGLKPKMWGPSIIGFGSYHYKYESGREGDAPLVGFSPRASAIVIYLSGHFEKREELLLKLGKHKSGGGCIYVKKLGDINIDVLREMIAKSVKHIRSRYPE